MFSELNNLNIFWIVSNLDVFWTVSKLDVFWSVSNLEVSELSVIWMFFSVTFVISINIDLFTFIKYNVALYNKVLA
jgi:hypothetical protein